MPLPLASAQVYGEQRFGEQVIAGAVGAVVVAGCRFDRQVDHIQLFIDGNLGPDTGIAGEGS